MKKLIVLSMMILGGLIFLACQKDEGAKLFEVSVEVLFPEGYVSTTKADVPVVMTNMISGIDVESLTNAEGKASFQVEGGSYNITSSFENDEFAFNGIIENRSVVEDGHAFEIQLSAMAKTGALVISEVFFAGSTTPAGANYNNDAYVEIYNNSDEIIFIDGLGLGVHASHTINPSQWIDAGGNILPRIPITFQTWMFPGNGEQYPVQPRTAIVVAIDGLDHTAVNPNSPSDLSNAEFETWVNHASDTDNPAVPNMIQVYTTSPTMNNWTIDVNGKAIILWKFPAGFDAADASHYMQNPTTNSGFQMFMVHQDWVVDAVEIVRPEEDRRNKQLPVVVDAGYVFNPNGRTHSVRRKVEKIIDGKVFLKDTNNSSNDWFGGSVPKPGIVPNAVD